MSRGIDDDVAGASHVAEQRLVDLDQPLRDVTQASKNVAIGEAVDTPTIDEVAPGEGFDPDPWEVG